MDIFPSSSTPPQSPSDIRCPKYLEAIPDVVAFNGRIRGEEPLLTWNALPPERPLDWQIGKLLDNFKRTFREARVKDGRFEPDEVDFDRIHGRLERPFRPKHNTDVRMGFCWDQGRMFLVKAFFTFGQRTVPEDRVHVYRTSEAPVLFYRYDPEQTDSRFKRRFRVQDRRFHPDDDLVMDRYVLQPHATYGVPPGTTYLVMTVRKTLLGVWQEACDHGRDYREPTADRTVVRRKAEEDDPDDCFASYLSDKKKRKSDAPPKKRGRPPKRLCQTPPTFCQSPPRQPPSSSPNPLTFCQSPPRQAPSPSWMQNLCGSLPESTESWMQNLCGSVPESTESLQQPSSSHRPSSPRQSPGDFGFVESPEFVYPPNVSEEFIFNVESILFENKLLKNKLYGSQSVA